MENLKRKMFRMSASRTMCPTNCFLNEEVINDLNVRQKRKTSKKAKTEPK